MNKQEIAQMKHTILEYNRKPVLSPAFDKLLEGYIKSGKFLTVERLQVLRNDIVQSLVAYANKYKISNVVIGLSGGIDSALSASLFRDAGYHVIGVTMPIEQIEEETERGIETAKALGIDHRHIDLTDAYHDLLKQQYKLDAGLISNDYSSKMRKGNIRARLRMITLYNLAGASQGFVASTDNFSELAAGFWTLHGDVGDVSPIQSLSKSWEVPALAEMQGVPDSVVFAVPTDGLGISSSDEDQFGFSYLEFDIALFKLLENMDGVEFEHSPADIAGFKNVEDKLIVNEVVDRIKGTTYKRYNPYNLKHTFEKDRYDQLDKLDNQLRR
jgi:nicotinamide-nucleotide amidase|tara:strand:- start:3921 stop:4904 length:984 start_codon:yes stop_codon:yes gene_type:complete